MSKIKTRLWLQVAKYLLSIDSRVRVKYFNLYKIRITYNIRECRDFKAYVSIDRILVVNLIRCQSGYILWEPWKPRALVLFASETKRMFGHVLTQYSFVRDCVCTHTNACTSVCLGVLCYVHVFMFVSYFWGWGVEIGLAVGSVCWRGIVKCCAGFCITLLNKASDTVIYAALKMFIKQLRDKARKSFCYEN